MANNRRRKRPPDLLLLGLLLLGALGASAEDRCEQEEHVVDLGSSTLLQRSSRDASENATETTEPPTEGSSSVSLHEVHRGAGADMKSWGQVDNRSVATAKAVLGVMDASSFLLIAVPFIIIMAALFCSAVHWTFPQRRTPARMAAMAPTARLNSQCSMLATSTLSACPSVRPIPVPKLNLSGPLLGPGPGLQLPQQETPRPVEPSVSPLLGSALSATGHSLNRYLCLELVVPAHNECSLVMRRLGAGGFGAADSVTIDDARGDPVFAATFSLFAQRKANARSEDRRLILRSAVDDAVFAYCKDREGSCLEIFHASDKPFGILQAEDQDRGGGYAVRTFGSAAMHFRGDLKSGDLNVVDEEGRLLAVSESAGPRSRALRIGPRVDSGLVSLALLGIDLLEMAAAAGPSPSVPDLPAVSSRALPAHVQD